MFGFYRVAAAVPRVYLADVEANTCEIIKLYKEASANGAAAVVFPEMCITGYTIGDLVFQQTLLQAAADAAVKIAEATKDNSCIAIVGLPLCAEGKYFQNGSAVHR